MDWRHVYVFLFLAILVVSDRPEIKNDVEDTIASLNQTATGHEKVGNAILATCVHWTPKTNLDETAVWFDDGKKETTFYGFKEGPDDDLELKFETEFCTEKKMDVIYKTDVDIADIGAGYKARHYKYLVPESQDSKFKGLAQSMLGTPSRRGQNYLPATTAGYGHPFVKGFLMLLSADNSDEETTRIWHILQYFGEEIAIPALKTPPEGTKESLVINGELKDTYDLFADGREQSTNDGVQWMKMSSAINQQSFFGTKATNTISEKNQDPRPHKKTKTAAQWLSFSEQPTPQTGIQHHLVKTIIKYENTTREDEVNYNILQFAEDKSTFEILDNSRLQNLIIVDEAGDFNFDDSDLVMHMEYAVPGDGAVFSEATLALMKKAVALKEIKYMILMKNERMWNGQTFFQVYQTFQEQKNWVAHQAGNIRHYLKKDGTFKNNDWKETSLGPYTNTRRLTKKTEKWVKQEALVNLRTDDLDFTSRS